MVEAHSDSGSSFPLPLEAEEEEVLEVDTEEVPAVNATKETSPSESNYQESKVTANNECLRNNSPFYYFYQG